MSLDVGATQTVPSPSLQTWSLQWAIIEDIRELALRSASCSGDETMSRHRGLIDFRFQTGNPLITLQKWSCEVWSWVCRPNTKVPKSRVSHRLPGKGHGFGLHQPIWPQKTLASVHNGQKHDYLGQKWPHSKSQPCCFGKSSLDWDAQGLERHLQTARIL